MPHDSAPKLGICDPWAPNHSRGAGGFLGGAKPKPVITGRASPQQAVRHGKSSYYVVPCQEARGFDSESKSLLVACGPRRCDQAREAEASRVRLDCTIGMLGSCRCACATALPSSPAAQGTHNMPWRIWHTVVLTTLNTFRRKSLIIVAWSYNASACSWGCPSSSTKRLH